MTPLALEKSCVCGVFRVLGIVHIVFHSFGLVRSHVSSAWFRVRDRSGKPTATPARRPGVRGLAADSPTPCRIWARGHAHISTPLDVTAFRIAQFKLRYALNPCTPPSRPYPLSLYPPNGDVGSNLLKVLAQMTPARSLVVMLKILLPLSVHTPALRP